MTVPKASHAGLHEFNPARPNPFDRPEMPNAESSAPVAYAAPGEALAIALLRGKMSSSNETRRDGSPPFFRVTTFDGPVVTITA